MLDVSPENVESHRQDGDQVSPRARLRKDEKGAQGDQRRRSFGSHGQVVTSVSALHPTTLSRIHLDIPLKLTRLTNVHHHPPQRLLPPNRPTRTPYPAPIRPTPPPPNLPSTILLPHLLLHLVRNPFSIDHLPRLSAPSPHPAGGCNVPPLAPLVAPRGVLPQFRGFGVDRGFHGDRGDQVDNLGGDELGDETWDLVVPQPVRGCRIRESFPLAHCYCPYRPTDCICSVFFFWLAEC